MTDTNEITDRWPKGVSTGINGVNRSINLLVKYQDELKGGTDSLLESLKTQYGNIQKAIEERNVSEHSQPTRGVMQKDLKNRVKKLINAKTLYGIALPLPNELSDSQDHQWEQNEGFVGSVVKGIENKVASGITNNYVKSAVGLFSKKGGELATQTGFRKALVNPGYFQDYNGSTPRNFTLSWDLIPANPEEAESIITIIYNLKKYTLPTSIGGGTTLLSPYFFEIVINNPRIDALINMTNVVCTNLTVNYAADGGLQFLPDGIPKYIKLSMSFAERTLVTSEFF